MKTVKLSAKESKYLKMLLSTDASRVDDVTIQERKMNEKLMVKL